MKKKVCVLIVEYKMRNVRNPYPAQSGINNKPGRTTMRPQHLYKRFFLESVTDTPIDGPTDVSKKVPFAGLQWSVMIGDDDSDDGDDQGDYDGCT